jgi:hypothetical protein
MILDQLFQNTCDEVGCRLESLFFVVAVDVRYRDVLITEVSLEMLYNDRPMSSYQNLKLQTSLDDLTKGQSFPNRLSRIRGDQDQTPMHYECKNRAHEFHGTITTLLTRYAKSEIPPIQAPIGQFLLAQFEVFRRELP